MKHKNNKIKKIASTIWELEQKCQNGEHVLENTHKMTELMSSLTFEEMLSLADIMDSFSCKNKNFLV